MLWVCVTWGILFLYVQCRGEEVTSLEDKIIQLEREMLEKFNTLQQELLSYTDDVWNDWLNETQGVNESTGNDMGLTLTKEEENEFGEAFTYFKDEMVSRQKGLFDFYESVILSWKDCRSAEIAIKTFLGRGCACGGPEKNDSTPSNTTEPASKAAYGLLIADEDGPNFKVLPFGFNTVRVLPSGKPSVTDVVYNYVNGKVYFSLVDSIWSSHLDGTKEQLVVRCNQPCIKLAFDLNLSALVYHERNETSRDLAVCRIPLYKDGNATCQDTEYTPSSILMLSTNMINMGSKKLLLAGHDGRKVHFVSGSGNLDQGNDTTKHYWKKGMFHEVYLTNSLSPSAFISPVETITRVPARPSGLVVYKDEVFIAYEHRPVIDVFNVVTKELGQVARVDKRWNAKRRMCLIY